MFLPKFMDEWLRYLARDLIGNGVINGRLNNNCNSTFVKHPTPAADIRIQALEETRMTPLSLSQC